MTYPRWIFGDPADTRSLLAPASLREVGPRLFVGSAFSATYSPAEAQIQLADECPPDHPSRTLRWPIVDGAPIAPELLDACLALARRWRFVGVTVCCLAGASRSASVAYALLRAQDGLPHEEALARVTVPDRSKPHPVTLASCRAWAEGRR